jgi:glutamine amidotransferase PdxT
LDFYVESVVVVDFFDWQLGVEALVLVMSFFVWGIQGVVRVGGAGLRKLGVDAVEIRKPEQLAGLSGLIIPGGESTTMAKLAEKNKLVRTHSAAYS